MDIPIDYNDTSGYNLLFLAVHNGIISLLPALLKKYSTTETVQGKTLINVAAARGHAEIVRLLTKNDKEGNSPLHIAIKEKQTSVFNLLVQKCNVNEKNCRDETPLHYAAMSDSVEFTKILIENGARVDVRDSDEKSPLDYALEKVNVELAEILFKNGAILTERAYNRWRPLSTAVLKGNLEMIKLLMARGWNKVDSPCNHNAPLDSAVIWGELKVVQYLMKNGTKSDETITEDGLDLFVTCIQQGRINILKFLIETGVKTKKNPFNLAMSYRRYKIWRFLLTCRSKIDSSLFFNETHLHSAVRSGQLEAVKIIVNYQTNPLELDSSACKLAVYIAVENKNEDILQVLLNAGYSTTGCFEDIGPLHLAATYDNTRLVEILLKAGVDINSATEKGLTPLHFAAIAVQPVVVKFLLESGANYTKGGNHRSTPLIFALDMFASTVETQFFGPQTFMNFVKITQMLITRERIEYPYSLLLAPPFIKVLSDESKQNCADDGREIKLRLNSDSGKFRPELLRCLFNHQPNDKILHFSKLILEEGYRVSKSPELLHVLMEYNDSKSCSNFELYSLGTVKTDYMCHLLFIDYSRNVNDLLNVHIVDDSSDEYLDIISVSDNEGCVVNNTTVLKLIIARLVLLTNSRDSRMSKFCGKHELHDWLKECKVQKGKMQKTQIADSFRMTFYDILTEPVEKVANYVRNENFCKIIDSSYEKLPAYTDFLKLHIEKGIRRKDLREECTNLMHNMIIKNHQIRFSNVDVDQILQYFTVVDMRRFSEALS